MSGIKSDYLQFFVNYLTKIFIKQHLEEFVNSHNESNVIIDILISITAPVFVSLNHFFYLIAYSKFLLL